MADIIDRVEIREYSYNVDGLSRDQQFNVIAVKGASLSFSTFALRIWTRDGAIGEYCPMWGGKSAQLGQALMIAPALLGRDPNERGAIWEDMKRALRQVGFLGVGVLDICLWDLVGKLVGLPIVDMLGRYRTNLPTYASTLHGSEEGTLTSKEAFGAFAEHCKALGYPAFKIHGWTDGNVKREIDNILHVRHVVGDDMELMIDPASVLITFADALKVGRACDEVGFFWYEDPMRDCGTSAQLAIKLRECLKTPLLLMEHVRGIEPKADWLVSRATDFVRADPELDLGITGTMKIAHIAEGFGLDCEVHACGPAHRHCMGAMRNSNYYELALVAPEAPNPVPPIYTCGYSEQLEDVGADGCFPVPVDRPGLGVTYDWALIERNTTHVHSFGRN
ncbi:MAG: enolase C-terminal domain-like protein [Pseudomonadota bacterium]